LRLPYILSKWRQEAALEIASSGRLRCLLRHDALALIEGKMHRKVAPYSALLDASIRPSWGFNDRATDRQSHAHPVGLRAEERIEQSICIFRADPGA
jgi:hypothetical protein